MKKFLIASVVLFAMVQLNAAPVDINGDFSKLDGALPAGWRFADDSPKKEGKIELVKGEKNMVKMTSANRAAAFVCKTAIPATNGDKFKITIESEPGKAGRLGFYLHDTKRGYITVLSKPFATGKGNTAVVELTLTDPTGKNKKIGYIYPLVQVFNKLTIEIHNITVEQIPQEK